MKPLKATSAPQSFRTVPRPVFLAIGLVGILSFLQSVEDPGKSVREFADSFVSGDVQNIVRIIDPEVMAEADIAPSDVANFVARFSGGQLRLDSFVVDNRFMDEDGTTERFQATLRLTGPQLAPEYPGNSLLAMTLLWILKDGRWWLERPVSVERMVFSYNDFPTAIQEEAATRFEAAMEVLSRLSPMASDKLAPDPPSTKIDGRDYKEIERLYHSERGSDGVPPTASGVQHFLRTARKNESGLLQVYRGDFSSGSGDKLPPVPWNMFQDYVSAAVKKGRLLEADGDRESAESIYRNLAAFGNQIAREPGGGLQFVLRGTSFEKQGMDELARMLPEKRGGEKEKARSLSSLLSRRLDTMYTAADCLDKMEDFTSLKAAIDAGNRKDDWVFRPLAVNTLCIFALKGASANSQAVKSAGGVVLVKNAVMEKVASEALEAIGGEQGSPWHSFVRFQKEWVRDHNVYGTHSTFR